MDMVLLIPNGLGAILGFIQMFLCLVAPRRETGETEVQDSHDVADIDDVEEAIDEEANQVAAHGVVTICEESEVVVTKK